MKKERGITIKINLSNRWLYFLITLGILVIISIGVYAYGTSNPSSFGHSVEEIDFENAPANSIPGSVIDVNSLGKVKDATYADNAEYAEITINGLYGMCLTYTPQGTQSNPDPTPICTGAASPASCSYNGQSCACPTSYIPLQTGTRSEGGITYNVYTCYRNNP